MEADFSPRALVVYAVSMAATVYVAIWAVLALLGPGGLISPTASPEPSPRPITLSAAAPAEVAPQTPPAPAPAPIVAGISGVPGDKSALVGQMQRALIKKGYRVGEGDYFDDDTMAALQAFQDDKALTVQPACDRQCWSALGLADPK